MDKGIIANFECPDCGKKWNTLFDSDAKKFVDHCTTKPKCLSDRKPVESYDGTSQVDQRSLASHWLLPSREWANRHMKFEDGNMVSAAKTSIFPTT
jgi:transposase-like protein